MKRIVALLLMLLCVSCLGEVLCDGVTALNDEMVMVEVDGEYTSKEEVALYLHAFAMLPANYLTKNDALALGCNIKESRLWDYAFGFSIGGDRFGNYEGILPDAKDRQWYECDIDYDGVRRNALRIVFSNDGLIYYTEDHYVTFELLYDGWLYEDAVYTPRIWDAAA